MDPMGEVLYVSDTSSRRVYRVRNLGQPKDPSRNLEVVAGTGEQCLPFDQSHCGEGRKATEAALNNPRGKRLKTLHLMKSPCQSVHSYCTLLPWAWITFAVSLLKADPSGFGIRSQKSVFMIFHTPSHRIRIFLKVKRFFTKTAHHTVHLHFPDFMTTIQVVCLYVIHTPSFFFLPGTE